MSRGSEASATIVLKPAARTRRPFSARCRDGRDEGVVEDGFLVLAVAASAHGDVERFADERRLAEQADAEGVEVGVRRDLVDGNVDERRECERRHAVDGALAERLHEDHGVGLPLEGDGVGRRHRLVHRRGRTHLLREPAALLVVAACRQRQRAAVEVGGVLSLPDRAGGGFRAPAVTTPTGIRRVARVITRRDTKGISALWPEAAVVGPPEGLAVGMKNRDYRTGSIQMLPRSSPRS